MFKRIAAITYFSAILTPSLFACTSAIVGAELNPYGRPLLWKNRDTSSLDNKVEYIPASDKGAAYVALFNAKDSLLREAWMGMNEYGFAVMNTASYNLKDDDLPQKEMDKEGIVMSLALRKCKTIKDFAQMLDTLPKPLGVEANFGVIDAYGDGGYFESNNHSYTFFNLKDSPDHILVRTNYSKSGRDNEGYGFIREENANRLLAPYIEKREVTPEVFTEILSRSFYHSLLDEDFSSKEQKWVIDQDFIPRYSSSATIVIEGCKPLEAGETLSPDFLKNQYIMWTGLGYPPCSEITAVWCTSEGVPNELKGDPNTGRAPQCDRVMERKREVFPFTKGNGEKYLDITKLFNSQQTGFVQELKETNKTAYSEARNKRD